MIACLQALIHSSIKIDLLNLTLFIHCRKIFQIFDFHLTAILVEYKFIDWLIDIRQVQILDLFKPPLFIKLFIKNTLLIPLYNWGQLYSIQ